MFSLLHSFISNGESCSNLPSSWELFYQSVCRAECFQKHLRFVWTLRNSKYIRDEKVTAYLLPPGCYLWVSIDWKRSWKKAHYHLEIFISKNFRSPLQLLLRPTFLIYQNFMNNVHVMKVGLGKTRASPTKVEGN